MTPMMPEAPEPQNRLMAGPGGMPGPVPGGNALMGGPSPQAAQGPPAAPPGPPPSPEEISAIRNRLGTVVGGLNELARKPRGELSKKDVFDTASDMIAKGAFPTPESKQRLVVELAGLPDDEPSLRKAIGALLLQVATNRAKVHQIHGPG